MSDAACRKAAHEGFTAFRLEDGANPMNLGPLIGDDRWNANLLADHEGHVRTLLYEHGFDAYALRRLAAQDEVDALYTLLYAAAYWES